MTLPRFASTREAARRMGFTDKHGQPMIGTFLRWTRKTGVPRPAGKHHLWWDMEAINEWLDVKRGVSKQSSETDWNKVFLEDLHGEHQSGISH